MSERISFQDELLKQRPIGRFLKSNEELERIHNEDGFDYAADFMQYFGHLLHKRKPSYLTRVQMNQDNSISFPYDTPNMNDAIWLEFESICESDASEKYVWRASGGREQYDLEICEAGWSCTYIQMNEQNAILRRYQIFDEQTISGIQRLAMLITKHNNKDDPFVVLADKLSQKIVDDTKEKRELELLEADRPTVAGRRRLESLRSSLFNAGFSAGSVDRSRIEPLLKSPEPIDAGLPQAAFEKCTVTEPSL